MAKFDVLRMELGGTGGTADVAAAEREMIFSAFQKIPLSYLKTFIND